MYSPKIWMLIGTSIVGIALFMYSRRYARLPETKYLQLLCAMAAAWAMLQAIDVCVIDLEGKVLLTQLKFIFAPYVCVAVFGLLISMNGRGDWFDRRSLIAISIVPFVTTVLALTVQWHTLFLYDFALAGQDPVVLRSSEGIWYGFYLLYSYGLMIVALIVLVDSTIGANALYKKQAAIMAISFIPPFLSDALQNYLQTFEEVDVAPMMFIFSGTLMAWGLYRYRILDIRPIARVEVVENMTDAMLMIDGDGRLIDINRSAGSLLSVPAGKVLGVPVSDAFPFGGEIARLIASGGPRGEITVGSGPSRRTFDASVMPVEVKEELRAHMVLMRDITERERAERSLKAAHERLGLLSSMTRHDLLNRLTVIDGYVDLAMREVDIDRIRTYLERTELSSEAARSLVEFTGDYESFGINAPSWLLVDDVFARATGQFPLDRIAVSSDVGGVAVYADVMLEKVLYNLVDNTLRHGGAVSRISFGHEMRGGGLVLVYRDDGEGISDRAKPHIFERGFGSHTGLGLFLARDVLAITGIEITERGEPGKGVRFELLVPPGGFRTEPQGDAQSPTSMRSARAWAQRTDRLISSGPPSSPTIR